MRDSLPLRLLSRSIPIMLASLMTTTGFVYWIARRQIVEDAGFEVKALAHSAAERLQAYFDQRKSDLITIAQSPLFRDHYKNVEYGLRDEAGVYLREIGTVFASLSTRTGAYLRLRYLDPSGRQLCVFADGTARYGTGPAGERWFLEALLKARPGQVLSSRILRAGTGAPVVLYGTPLFDEAGRARGAVVFDCDLAKVYKSLSRLTLGSYGRTYLAERQRGSSESLTKSRIVRAVPIRGTPWAAVTSVDRDALLNRLKTVGAAALALAGALSLLASWLLAKSVGLALRPLRDLTIAAEAFSRGELDTRVRVAQPSEVAALADAFNLMAERLQQRVRELTALEARYRTAVENSPDAIARLDHDLRVTFWNRKAEELFGYPREEVHGRTPAFLFDQEDYDKLHARIIDEGRILHAKVMARGKSGQRYELDLSCVSQDPTGTPEWFLVMHDLTEIRRLQSHLVQNEKLSAVGTLIAGVAHELNNPLAAVVGFAEMLYNDVKLDLPQAEKEDLRLLHQSALHCRDIVLGLLTFARKSQPAGAQRIAVNEALRATLALMEYKLIKSESVELAMDLDPRDPEVAGHFQKLQQVLVNLLSNASDALRGAPEPRRIRLRSSLSGDRVLLTIEDNGPGIPAESRQRIFEPFFTTKPEGAGTGLGLSISAEIVSEMGGTLRHEPCPQGGARFIVDLPACPPGVGRPERPDGAALILRGLRALVVDDEPDVLRLMSRTLDELGFSSSAVSDYEEARRLLRQGPFDLVVADVDMGRHKGTHLMREAKALGTFPAFLIVTGDVLNPALTDELSELEVPVLGKPFLRTEFVRLVRQALRGKRPGSGPA